MASARASSPKAPVPISSTRLSVITVAASTAKPSGTAALAICSLAPKPLLTARLGLRLEEDCLYSILLYCFCGSVELLGMVAVVEMEGGSGTRSGSSVKGTRSSSS
eukprot:4534082-Amphidinium_carterae.1